jgi:hypothetical protein
MRVRRGYLIALLVIALGGGWTILHPSTDRAGSDPLVKAEQDAQAQARRELPQAMAALARLHVPAGARVLTRGCRWYRCYLIGKPTAQAASIMPGIRRSLGVGFQQTLGGCNGIHNRFHGLVVMCAESHVIDDNVIAVFLEPYLGCPPGPCRWTDTTELDISLPSGAPAASS